MQVSLRHLDTLRPWPVYLLAASLPFSMAAVSTSKLLLLLSGLAMMMVALRQDRTVASLHRLRSVPLILGVLAILAASITYSSAPLADAVHGWVKYAKLLIMVLILASLRSEREARTAILVLLAAQTFVMFTSFVMSTGWRVPWVSADRYSPIRMFNHGTFSAYSSYLDQALMTVGYICMCWHLRVSSTNQREKTLATGLTLIGIVCVMVLLPARSAHVALVVVVLLAMRWRMGRQRRTLAMLAPALLLTVGMCIPSSFQERVFLVITETRAYAEHAVNTTSTGIRLELWHRALQAIADKPVAGTGLASFDHEFRQREGSNGLLSIHKGTYNPHQEYLQWGVQLGVGGVALLVALFVSLILDARQLPTPARRATQSLVAVFAVACLFNSALYDALIGDYFCSAIGMLLALGLHARPAPDHRSPESSPA